MTHRELWIIAIATTALGLAAARSSADEAQPLEETAINAEDRQFWAFQPPAAAPLPDVDSVAWPQSAIDRFTLSALESRGLAPAPPAAKRALIRRATFDLHGLPPTQQQIDEFLADTSNEAFAKVVDRLLASPRYGERWGRHWLDLARYSDSNGMDENMAMAEAWRYRDWVVRAFNDDLPYDRFIRDQLAGDLLPPADDATNFNRMIATGFLVLGPKMLAEDDPAKMEMDIIDEQVDTVGRVFMGLTLGCARCHDHKFDPISLGDYYGLAGIFKSTKTMEHYRVVARWLERPMAVGDELARLEKHVHEVDRVKGEIKTLEEAAKQANDTKAASDSPDTTPPLAKLKEELKALEKSKPNVPFALAVADRGAENLRVHLRGDHTTLGPEVPRRFPRILGGDGSQSLSTKASGRLELANWLVRPQHPLTARVMVNRIWQGHFGQGLVRSSDNFGKLGESPDHQPLLDWLARRFVESGWSIKSMHRLIMLSITYQMSTDHNERAAAIDPENRLLWHISRRRLSAEEIRDALLAVVGGLDLAMGGTLLANKSHTYVTSTASVNDVKYDNQRRSIYLPVVRSSLYDMFSAFDFADPSTANGKRPSTTVAPQALFMMNSTLVERQTRSMAESLLTSSVDGESLRVAAAYLRAYGRPPTDNEVTGALAFIARYQAHVESREVAGAEARMRAWQALCRAILSANEFVYVE